jgi:hypothetical protein
MNLSASAGFLNGNRPKLSASQLDPGGQATRISFGAVGIRSQIAGEPFQSPLLSLVCGNGVFRWRRSTLHLFQGRFLLRERPVRWPAFPGRSAFSGTCAPRSLSSFCRRTTFCSGTSLGSCAPFCSGGTLQRDPLFSSRAPCCPTVLTVCMLPPVRASTLTKKIFPHRGMRGTSNACHWHDCRYPGGQKAGTTCEVKRLLIWISSTILPGMCAVPAERPNGITIVTMIRPPPGQNTLRSRHVL